MKHHFRPYQDCNIFIETGTNLGEGVIAALNVGFPIIHSIELASNYHEYCKKLFVNEPQVILHQGNSLEHLPKILANINERCVFWLDAHWCGQDTEGSLSEIVLMEELKIIADHHIKEHTILIDDVRLIRNKELEWCSFSYTIYDIEEFIHNINPDYKIHYEYGIVENDILIAKI